MTKAADGLTRYILMNLPEVPSKKTEVSQIFTLPPSLQTLPYFQVEPAVVLQSFVAPPGLLASSEIRKEIQFDILNNAYADHCFNS